VAALTYRDMKNHIPHNCLTAGVSPLNRPTHSLTTGNLVSF